MRTFTDTEVGRGISGVVISIGITLAVLLPVMLMEVCSKIFSLA